MTPASHKNLVLIAEGLADGLMLADACRRVGVTPANGRNLTHSYAPVLTPWHSDKPLCDRARSWLVVHRDVDPALIKFVKASPRESQRAAQERNAARTGRVCRYYLAKEMRECGRPSGGRVYCPTCAEKTLNPNERGVFTRGLV